MPPPQKTVPEYQKIQCASPLSLLSQKKKKQSCFHFSMCVACRLHTCHFKALTRCGRTGTATTVGGPHTVQYCIIIFIHIHSCRNTQWPQRFFYLFFLMRNIMQRAPCLHLWRSFDKPASPPASGGHFAAHLQKSTCCKLYDKFMLSL